MFKPEPFISLSLLKEGAHKKMHQILGMKRSASVKTSRAASQRMGARRGMNVSAHDLCP